MHIRLLDLVFIAIGITIGIILSLQIRADPIRSGSFPLEQLEVKKSLLESFFLEQENLKKELQGIEEKKKEAQNVIERRSSSKTRRTLDRLKKLTGFQSLEDKGVRITLSDHSSVSRADFSSINENFVQATDLRDIVNGLFLKDAAGISINGKRISPLTSIQSAFDNILVGNFQIVPPFSIEAIGNPVALQEAVHSVKKSKIRIFVDSVSKLKIPSLDSIRSIKFISLYIQ